MNVARPIAPVTLEEFERMDKDGQIDYELIDGIVMMSHRPTVGHQMIRGNLYYQLRKLLSNKECIPIQEVDLLLESNLFEPDLLVVLFKIDDLINLKRYEKVPLIAIEIVSPSTSSRDYIVKRHKYEVLGIKEYWIISPEEKCITIFDFTVATHEMYCTGEVQSNMIPEIHIPLSDIFYDAK